MVKRSAKVEFSVDIGKSEKEWRLFVLLFKRISNR